MTPPGVQEARSAAAQTSIADGASAVCAGDASPITTGTAGATVLLGGGGGGFDAGSGGAMNGEESVTRTCSRGAMAPW